MNDEVGTGLDAVLLGVAELAVPHLPELCYLTGAAFVLLGWVGWRQGRRWPAGVGTSAVTDGIYRLVRRPQYVGVLLIALGLFIRWATLPFPSIWPLLLLSSWAAGQDRFGPEPGLLETLRDYGILAGTLLSRL